ncbi:hypothetical protein N7510_000509 [Penicillium lagena]|uniref:uncharacterized protein n=1 Tax=Penicillium lagena TaxID=94218 RepID=UPI0025421759|nr:uncharacterized protein N7510_000509 [Penicillium lagena]KAJ5624200.1 hypothetical protein N7510_000509 [Penicillium lagena]
MMKLLFSTSLSTFVTAALATPSVTIDAGILHGKKCSNGQDAVFYKGIPFAEPPVGDLRFEPPKTYSKQYPNGVLEATTHAATCIQLGDDMIPPGPENEDCLYLDIWTPYNATKDSVLPVKIWVYGGSDTSGGIDYSLYDGCNIAEDGSILVSINYRLGPLGFMALSSAGIHEKVVLFGQSAGVTDVFTISTLPQAPSLFNSAIAESIALPSLMSNSTLQNTGASYAQSLQCSVYDKSCLQSRNVTDLKHAYNSDAFLNEGLGAISYVGIDTKYLHEFWPYVDGIVISENPLTRGIQVPIIFGYNQKEGMMDTLTKYDSKEKVKLATPAAYTEFLRYNWGTAAQIIEKHYPLSLFKSATNSIGLAVIAAMATVNTDVHFKCSGYQCAMQATRKNFPAWMYEFTHNSTCAWLNTMPQAEVSLFGAAHTAEIPCIFGNLHFDFPSKNTTCTGKPLEWNLSKQMMSLWTAMAENASPSTEAIHWPQFQITSSKLETPGMIFGNSSAPGSIDIAACRLWTQVDAMLAASNATDTGTPSSGTGKPSSLPTSGATTTLSASKDFAALSMLLMGLAVLA